MLARAGERLDRVLMVEAEPGAFLGLRKADPLQGGFLGGGRTTRG